MPDNLPSIIMMGLMMLVSLLAFCRWMAKKLVPVKTVQAKVIDKHITKIAYSKTVSSEASFLNEVPWLPCLEN